jgi:hypothetical protein
MYASTLHVISIDVYSSLLTSLYCFVLTRPCYTSLRATSEFTTNSVQRLPYQISQQLD